jgi:hypothetical protein
MCLPAGYALLEGDEADADAPPRALADSTVAPSLSPSAAASPAFRFVSPLVLKSSMNGLLLHCSPVYACWFETQMMERMNALASRQDDEDEEE